MKRLGTIVVSPLTRPLVRDAVYRTLEPIGIEVAHAAFGRATFKKLAAHQARFGMRWSSDDAILAK